MRSKHAADMANSVQIDLSLNDMELRYLIRHTYTLIGISPIIVLVQIDLSKQCSDINPVMRSKDAGSIGSSVGSC